MKILISSTLITAIVFSCATLAARDVNKLTSAKYQPVIDFLETDATLSQWFKQYVDTSAGGTTFSDFLKRLSSSEILWQRSRRAGLNHNQLYSPIVTLLGKDWKSADKMSREDLATIRLSMLELDIALSAVEATLPNTALEEFRREVLRGAKPLTEVAKLPMSAVEAMSFTIMDHKVSDRINKPSPAPKKDAPSLANPELESNYRLR